MQILTVIVHHKTQGCKPVNRLQLEGPDHSWKGREETGYERSGRGGTGMGNKEPVHSLQGH